MKSKITFNKSGSGSVSARLTIPSNYVTLMGINEGDREVDIKLNGNGIMEIKKSNTNFISNATYDETCKYILNKVEYTYNVLKCLKEFIQNMQENGTIQLFVTKCNNKTHFLIFLLRKVLTMLFDNVIINLLQNVT